MRFRVAVQGRSSPQLLVVAVVAVLLSLVQESAAQIDFGTHLARLNQYRAAAGLSPVQIDSRLNSCANAHAIDMRDVMGLSHSGSDGSTPGDRIRRCVGQNDIFAGENAGAGFSNDLSVLQSWFDSPGHRANMLNGDYQFVGIGRAGSYWVQNFAGGLRNGGGSSGGGSSGGGNQQQPSPSPSPSPRRSPSPSPRPQSPSPRAQSPSPTPQVPATTAAAPTTAPALNTTEVVHIVTRVNSPIPVPTDGGVETGILVENIPGLDSIVPSDFDTSQGDLSGSSADDIDERLYAGSEDERRRLLAEAAMKELSEDDQAAFVEAREVYGDVFNPFMLVASAGERRMGMLAAVKWTIAGCAAVLIANWI